MESNGKNLGVSSFWQKPIKREGMWLINDEHGGNLFEVARWCGGQAVFDSKTNKVRVEAVSDIGQVMVRAMEGDLILKNPHGFEVIHPEQIQKDNNWVQDGKDIIPND